jgi:hypothetical protein
MAIARKHISKSGKSVLVFRRQPVIGSAGVIPREANSSQDGARTRPLGGPAISIDAVPDWFADRSTLQRK